MKNRRRKIENMVRKLGVNGTYKGFSFLIYGIDISIDNPDILLYVCKGIYIDIAVHFKTNMACVERNLRTVKEIIFQNKDNEFIYDVFGYDVDEKIKNAEFIDCLVNYFKEHFDE